MVLSRLVFTLQDISLHLVRKTRQISLSYGKTLTILSTFLVIGHVAPLKLPQVFIFCDALCNGCSSTR